MKKRRILATLAIIAILITGLSFTALAHSGRTDSAGGHHDYNNVSGLGSYHYHHGYPAHLHPGGVCPYATTSTPSTTTTTTTPTTTAPAVTTKTLTAAYPGISIYLNNSLKMLTEALQRLSSSMEQPICQYALLLMPSTQQQIGTALHTPLLLIALTKMRNQHFSAIMPLLLLKMMILITIILIALIGKTKNISYSIPTWQMSQVIFPARTAGTAV